MGLTAEKVNSEYTCHDIQNDINRDFRHQNIKDLIFCEHKTFKMQSPDQYLHQVNNDSFDKDKNHKSVFHSIEHYFTNAVSYKKLNKTKKHNIHHYLHKNNLLNMFKTVTSFKGCATTSELDLSCSVDNSIDSSKICKYYIKIIEDDYF